MSKADNDSTSEPISTWVEINYAEAGRKGVELVRKSLLEASIRAQNKAEANHQGALAEAKHREQAQKELEATQPLKEKTLNL